jgi:hypothetical protein
MLSIAAIVLCLALTFCYRALNPAHHPVPTIAKRVRVALGAVIMILSVTTGYLLPVEVGDGLSVMAYRQQQQQETRMERRMAAEKRHVTQMIEIFGGTEGYLTYLSGKTSQKQPF